MTLTNWPKRSNAGNNLYLPFGLPPTTEREVVYLFKAMAGPYFGFSEIVIQNRFPDCLARKGKERIRIEFEFESKNFRTFTVWRLVTKISRITVFCAKICSGKRPASERRN
jgi:hypothetical protein